VQGGGAAAAVAASLGAASGSMACIYTTRKKDQESGVAEQAKSLAERLAQAAQSCLDLAERDAEAYAKLQQTWKKDCPFSPEQVDCIKQEALDVPVTLLKTCHENAELIDEFIPRCNPNIISDAKVAIHLLAGGARAAYQTVLVNQPNDELKNEMRTLLDRLRDMETSVLEP